MADNRRRVLGWIGITALLLAAILMWRLVTDLRSGAYLDLSDRENPTLGALWFRLVPIIKLGTSAHAAFATVLAIVAAAIGVVARTFNRTWQIVAVVLVCGLGIFYSLELMSEIDVGNELRVKNLGYFGDFPGDVDTTAALITSFCQAMLGWFAAYAAAMLGISLVKDGGAIHEGLEKLFGRDK